MWVFRRTILKDMILNSDSMAFSEEIKIEAIRNRRIRFEEISRSSIPPASVKRTEPLARRLLQPLLSA